MYNIYTLFSILENNILYQQVIHSDFPKPELAIEVIKVCLIPITYKCIEQYKNISKQLCQETVSWIARGETATCERNIKSSV